MEKHEPKTKESTSNKPSVILVGIVLDGDNRLDVDDSLLELEKLVDTLGGVTVARLVQSRQKIHPSTFIGRGKTEALAELVKSNKADWIALYGDLSPCQSKNLEKITGVPVVDRCGVILNIFSRHARTAVAKMQVELANLEYLLPRLKQAWTHLSRQQGGIGVRGVGEKQIELDRRAIRKRISVVKKKLSKVSTQRDVQRQVRRDVFKVALVGYTNSGKSTMLNSLTDAGVYVQNKLFSTLDAKVANFAPPFKPTILISDTVGFIRKLPHGLVESFKSTLEEAALSDLLLQVVDLSDRRFEKHISVGNEVLEELGLANHPRIIVFNKIDNLAGKMSSIVTSVYKNSVAVSARSGEGLDDLKDAILTFFDERLQDKTIELEYGDGNLLSRLYETSRVHNVEYLDGRVRVNVRATRAELARLKSLLEKEGN